MNKENALRYIRQRDWRHSRLGLERIQELLKRLGNPQQKLKFIHLAGTNGKGSTAAFCAAVLSAAGYKTGLFTSPYVQSFNERYQIDGVPISDDAFGAATLKMAQQANQMQDHPTEFEMVTAVGFLYFAEQECDIVVLETGLGGRLDATNSIAAPELAVITPMAIDHAEQLGDTLPAIAEEKAGIIKAGTQVVLAPQQAEAAAVIQQRCDALCVPLHTVAVTTLQVQQQTLDGQRFDYSFNTDYAIRLLGVVQPINAATAITAMRVLRQRGWAISDSALRHGLEETRWPARFELLHCRPYVVLDGGHNPAAVAALKESLTVYFPRQRFIFIVGFMADKDWRPMVDAMVPLAHSFYCVTPPGERALGAAYVVNHLQQQGVAGATACTNAAEALQEALATASPDDVICVFGTFYMAGEIRALFD